MKKLVTLVALLVSSGCSFNQKALVSTVTASKGTVANIDISVSDMIFEAKEITITFTDDGMITTFTDIKTGNRISIHNNCMINNVKNEHIEIRDLRTKDVIDDSSVKSTDTPKDP